MPFLLIDWLFKMNLGALAQVNQEIVQNRCSKKHQTPDTGFAGSLMNPFTAY